MDVTALLADHPVVDGHNDLLWTARVETGYDFEALDVGVGGTPTHTDLPRLRAGGSTANSCTSPSPVGSASGSEDGTVVA